MTLSQVVISKLWWGPLRRPFEAIVRRTLGNGPRILKVDVEGAETRVLEGARRLLGSEPAPRWILEIHDEENERTVSRLLARNQYRSRNLRSQREKEYPFHLLA